MIVTERLRLRAPEARDVGHLYEMWCDPRVMADLGPVKTRAQTLETIARHDGYRAQGLGFWSVELRENAALVGFCGLKPGAAHTPAEGEIEIGWTICSRHWGQGYAFEASIAGLRHAWEAIGAARVVAITSARNTPSRALMAKLGMRHMKDFDHPIYASDDPLRASVLYAVDRPDRGLG